MSEYLPHKEKTFAKRNPQTGLIEIISEETFEVVAVQRSLRPLLTERENKLQRYTTADGREIFIEPGIDGIGTLTGFPFSDVTVDLICDRIICGESLSSICKEPGFPPYSIIARWMRKFPEVKQAIETARKDRAEALRDEALDIVDKATEDDIQVAKARADMRKWAAQVDDPSRFNKSEKATVGGALHIVVNTGILRPGDPGFRDVTNIQIKENDNGKDSIQLSDSGSGECTNSGDRSAPVSGPIACGERDDSSLGG